MRTLYKVEEFTKEAQNAIFTKQQALEVTKKILELELADSNNTDEEKRIFTQCIETINIKYFDNTATHTDFILDSYNVARITIEDIAQAVRMMIFDAE